MLHRNLHTSNISDQYLQANSIFGWMVIGSIIAGQVSMLEEMVTGTILRTAGCMYPVTGRLVHGVVHGHPDIGNDVVVKLKHNKSELHRENYMVN